MSVFKENESYRPFTYGWAMEAAKEQAIDMHWDVHQIDLKDDLRQYSSKSGLETANYSHDHNKETMDTLLFLFTELDRSVCGGYINLLPYTKNNEIKVLFITEAERECVHQRAYALLAEALGFSDSDWRLFQQYKEMKDKLDVIEVEEDDLTQPINYAKALTRLLLGEGIGLFAAFVILLNFKRSGLLMGFNDVNEWSLSDETFHVENNIKVLDAVREELSYVEKLELKRFTLELVARYVEVEKNFIELMYKKGGQEDLTQDDICAYMDFLGDLREYQLEYRDFKDVRDNPLEWMDWLLSGEKHDNFFEKKVTSYSHGGLAGEVDYAKYQVLLAQKEEL